MGSTVFHGGWLSTLLLSCCLFAGGAIAGESADTKRLQYVKAAFVLNVARFVTWPSGAFETEDSPYTLCIYRRNSLGQAIEGIRGKTISKRELQIDVVDSFTAAASCTILFIPHDELPHYEAQAPGTSGRPQLTIADLTEEGALTGVPHQGVIVSLVRVGTKIKLEVDLQQSRNAGLQLNAQLLQLARIVRNGNH